MSMRKQYYVQLQEMRCCDGLDEVSLAQIKLGPLVNAELFSNYMELP
jgi:hypothetical protein